MRSWLVIVGVITAAGLVLAPATASAARPACKVERLASEAQSYNSNTHADPLGTAIAEAAAGDTLQVIGTCRGNFVVDKNLTLQGRAADSQVDRLEGNGSGTVLTVGGGATLVAVEIRHLAIGNGETGIVRRYPTDLTLNDSTVSGNAGVGIARSCDACGSNPLTLNNSSVSYNGHGIATALAEGVTLNSSTVSHNVGAGIYTTGFGQLQIGVVVLNRSAVHANGGVGINIARGSATLVDSTVSENGGVGLVTAGGTITGNNATIRGNKSGGISFPFGRVTLTDSTVSDNLGSGITGPSVPGGSYIASLTRTTVRGNHGGNGGGIRSVNAVLVDSTVTGNSATGFGGGIYTPAASLGSSGTLFGMLILTRSTVTGNTAGTAGGGIYQESGATLTLDDASGVCGNTPDDAPQCLPSH